MGGSRDMEMYNDLGAFAEDEGAQRCEGPTFEQELEEELLSALPVKRNELLSTDIEAMNDKNYRRHRA